jgi:polar amino acid transport system substrate-binding protein
MGAALVAGWMALGLSAREFQPGEVYRSIQAHKVVRIAVAEDYPPLSFNKGERGVEIEWVKRLADFLGAKAELVPLPVSEFHVALEQGRVDLAVGGYSRDLVRARTIWFSEPYLSTTPGVLVDGRRFPQGRFREKMDQVPVRTLWDLKRFRGIRLAVEKGSTYEQLVAAELPEAERVLVGHRAEGVQKVMEDQVDGFVFDALYLDFYRQSHPKAAGATLLLQGGEHAEKLCVGLPFGDTLLKNQIDVFIAESNRLGLLDRAMREYALKTK